MKHIIWALLMMLALFFGISFINGYDNEATAREEMTYWAENRSYSTTCAEKDNVNIPLFAESQIEQFRVVATHPQYPIDPGDYPCPPIWEGCEAGDPVSSGNTCSKLWDDGTNVIEVCSVPSWWRPYRMKVRVNGETTECHYLRLYQKIENEASWPQFFVLYEDGNVRLKPHPPNGMADVCFGSSVIIGPATPDKRPFVDIREVEVYPEDLALKVTYREGSTAYFHLAVDRSHATLDIDVGYQTDAKTPFAIFRSMWVKDGLADADHVRTAEGAHPILGDWQTLKGPWWYFHRSTKSEHNPSSSDIWIGLTGRERIQANFMFYVVDERLHKFRFDASTSIDTMGEIVRYEWDWDGDGVYDTAVQVPEMMHRFDGEGPYQVILTIVDDQGNRASCTNEVQLEPSPTAAGGEGVGPQQELKVLRVGTFTDYAPFEYVDEHGHLDGFDVALMEEIAKLSGYQLKWLDLPFETLITNLIEGKLDVIAAALSITEKRKVIIAFTEPYWEAPEDPAGPLYAFAVRKTDIDLLTALNSGLEQLGASDRYEQLVERYMK